MPFVNGGYYNYDRLLYQVGLTTKVNLTHTPSSYGEGNESWYNPDGRLMYRPTSKGIYIKEGKKHVIK